MQITTDRFTLRPWRAEDALLARHADNIRIWRNVRDCFPHPYTAEDARAYIGYTLSEPEIENLAIVINGQAVGGVGIDFLTDIQRYNAELGYWLGEPYWGQGLMSEIIAATCAHLFRATRINRIFAPSSTTTAPPCGYWRKTASPSAASCTGPPSKTAKHSTSTTSNSSNSQHADARISSNRTSPATHEKGRVTRTRPENRKRIIRTPYRISETAAFSSRSSFTVASIFSREKASIGRP